MAGDTDNTFRKWNIIKEQLISLCALSTNPKNTTDLKKTLNEDISLKNINAQILISICYFLLGVIDIEERDKLIQWPITNIQRNTKFRKGLSAMVLHFQEKYPWAYVKKLPESYFINPHSSPKKLVDFLLRLTNLAIHLVLNEPDLLMMHPGDGLNEREVKIMMEVILEATQREEKQIGKKVIPVEEYEIVKNDVTDQCIFLREKNNNLEHSINHLFKCAVKDNILKNENDGIEELKIVKDQKLSDLTKINSELMKYYQASKEFLGILKAIKNPICLTAKDFNCENSTSTVAQETRRVCDDLHELFRTVSSYGSTREEESKFYEKLVALRTALKKENEALKVIISKISNVQ